MDWGISVATSAESWKLAVRAEELGFTHAWFYDTQMLNADPFVVMGAAAVNTSRIQLGTGVLIPSNRIAPVTANCLASLNKLAPGRINLGISTGFTGRRAMGLGAITLDHMAEYIRVVQGLLADEIVEWDAEGRTRKIKFLNPELDTINIDDPVGLHISALGPRGKKLTAELGAGWINAMRDADQGVAQITLMKESWAAAGRDANELYATAHTSGSVVRAGEAHDSPRVKAQAGPAAVMVLHDTIEDGEQRTLGYQIADELKPFLDEYREIYKTYTPQDARYLRVHRWHLMKLRPEEEHMATASMIAKMSFTGEKEFLRDEIRRLLDAGYKQISAHIRYGQDAMIEDWAEVFDGV